MTSRYFKTRLHEGLALRFRDLDYVNVVYYAGGWNTTPRFIQAQVGRSMDDLILETGSAIQDFTRDYFIFTTHLLQVPREGDIILDQNYQTLYSRVGAHESGNSHFRYTNETNRRMRVHTTVQQHTPPELDEGVPFWLSVNTVSLNDAALRHLNTLSPQERLARMKELAK